MRRALIGCALACFSVGLFLSCDDDSPSSTTPPPGFIIETHVIRDVDYVKDRYFLFDDLHHFIGPRVADPQIEVYRTVTPADLIRDPSIQRFPGWVMTDSVGDGQTIRDAAELISSGQTPGWGALIQDFELLQPGVDYDLIIDAPTQQTVGIKLVDPVPAPALKAIGVRYVNNDGVPVGGSYTTLGITSALDTLMLEMIKAPDPRPNGPFGAAWRLMMRNFYDVGFSHIDPHGITVTIEDILNTTRVDATKPEGASIRYLRIFGLDITDATGSGPPDGLIDLSGGFIDLGNGILQFPDLRAFAPDPQNVQQWTGGQFAFTGQFEPQHQKSAQIYDYLLNPTQTEDVHQYIIRVKVTVPTS